MPRLVFTPRYLKMQKPSKVKNYVKWTIVNKVDTKKENKKEKVKF